MKVDQDRMSKRLASLTSAKPVDAPLPPVKLAKPVRASLRSASFKIGKVVLDDKSVLRCVIKDLSETGARIALEGAFTLSSVITLKIAQTGATLRAAVVWQKDTEVGLAFVRASS